MQKRDRAPDAKAKRSARCKTDEAAVLVPGWCGQRMGAVVSVLVAVAVAMAVTGDRGAG